MSGLLDPSHFSIPTGDNFSKDHEFFFQNDQPHEDSTSPEEDTDMGYPIEKSTAKSPDNVKEYFASKKTKDGKIPKKRGPKPDSKPARDRRQELNRQAQRNHRHRKEEQQKWLEQSLADAQVRVEAAMQRANQAEQQREQTQGENERLKQLLDVNGIPIPHSIPQANHLDIERPSIPQHHEQFQNQSTSTSSLDTPAPPSSTYSAQSPNSADTEMRRPSNASADSPMDSSDEYDAQSSSSQMQGYQQYSINHQTSLDSTSNTDPSTDQLPGSITAPASAPVASPLGLIDQSFQGGAYCVPQPNNPVPDATHLAPSIDYTGFNQTSSPTLVNAPIQTPNQDPLAIKDHDQTGVEFILALETNCHDHMTLMNSRTFASPPHLGGHSLMLTKVPVPVAKSYQHGDPEHAHALPDVGSGPGKYARLLNLAHLSMYSRATNYATLSGEISPAQALGFIRKDPRYAMLNRKDFDDMTEVLKLKSRCYGFGAVVEAYEVRDVLADVFAGKGLAEEEGFAPESEVWRSVPLSCPDTFDGPMYPNLGSLMGFDVAGLMSERQKDREMFLVADLGSFDQRKLGGEGLQQA